MPPPSGLLSVPPQMRQPPDPLIQTAGSCAPAPPVKPAPGSQKTFTPPPATTRFQPVNSPGILTIPSTSYVWPAAAEAIAVTNWDAVLMTIAFERSGLAVFK